MLELRPSCENCACELAADSQNAMICSYECTFCITCVEETLGNVCPNCGGGFYQRPVRPKKSWCKGTGLNIHPATKKTTIKPVNKDRHSEFNRAIQLIPSHLR
jgi:uncharacterized protein